MYTATQTLVLTEQSEDQNEDDPFISANNEVYIITIVYSLRFNCLQIIIP